MTNVNGANQGILMFVNGYGWARLRPIATWVLDHAAAEAAALLFALTLVSVSLIAVQSLGFPTVYAWLVSNTQWVALHQLLLGALTH
ncbi:MAG TPA: hypothetical protein VGF33_10150 [Caulobacteraceae bacterium]